MIQDVNDIVTLVLGDADAAHRQHLATESYAEHMALGDFYDTVRGQMDALAEALIAMGQKPKPIGRPALEQLKDGFGQLQALRSVCDGLPAAENLFDDITSTYLSAIYKLARLR